MDLETENWSLHKLDMAVVHVVVIAVVDVDVVDVDVVDVDVVDYVAEVIDHYLAQLLPVSDVRDQRLQDPELGLDLTRVHPNFFGIGARLVPRLLRF